jgi:hypothetical protein
MRRDSGLRAKADSGHIEAYPMPEIVGTFLSAELWDERAKEGYFPTKRNVAWDRMTGHAFYGAGAAWRRADLARPVHRRGSARLRASNAHKG